MCLYLSCRSLFVVDHCMCVFVCLFVFVFVVCTCFAFPGLPLIMCRLLCSLSIVYVGFLCVGRLCPALCVRVSLFIVCFCLYLLCFDRVCAFLSAYMCIFVCLCY